MRPDLILICPLIPSCVAALEQSFTVHRYYEVSDRAALLAEIGPNVRAVATDGHYGCPADVAAACPQLEIISSYGVGYDGIDIGAARARGIRVTNTPDVLNDAVAELAIGLMISLARQMPQADRYVRAGRWAVEGAFPLATELTGRTLGILGLGRIGKEIAVRAQAMRMRVVYHGRSEQPDQPYQFFASLKEMAGVADWLMIIAPGSAETTGIVSREILAALGPSGRLVNVARGSLIDEPALVEMLRSGELGGAALDVFAEEPRVPEELLALDNVVLSPHQGSATDKTRFAMGDLVVRNLAAHFAGNPLISPVV